MAPPACAASSRLRSAGLLAGLALTALALFAPAPARAGAFVFSGEANGVDVVTHPTGYTGSGGTVSVTVCIDPTSANAAEMEIPVRNIVDTWNQRDPITGNLLLGGSNDIPSNGVDFESVALHELGHCIGEAHPNLASESNLSDPQANATKSTDGADNGFDTNNGADDVYGSSDDLRDDDVNLHWFRKSNNNPFSIANTVDSSTYSRDLADLPSGDNFAANGDRSVSSLLGVPNTEAVMQQGTFVDEDQRRLSHDDAATLLYAMSGIDEIAGTSDDYALSLSYGGLATNCDVILDFDNAQTGFAVCQVGGAFISGSDHVRITSAEIFFNTGFSWHFNDVLTADHAVVFEAVVSGGVSSSSTVTTSSSLTGVAGHLYLAAVSYRPDTTVTGVSGLGLGWNLVDEHCSGEGQTGVSVWQALGTPTGDGTVTATLASSVNNAVIAVTRYSDVRGSAAVTSVVQGNTNGIDGTCSGGSNTSSYSFIVTTTGTNSRVYGTVGKRNRFHTPGAGYVERAEVQSGNGNSAAGVAVEDAPVAAPSSVTVNGSFNAGADWAFVGLEILAAECLGVEDCDDLLFCNGAEACVAGACQAGIPVDCDDLLGCTVDSCNETTDQCDHVPDPSSCDDGNACTAESCDEFLGCLSEPIPGCAGGVLQVPVQGRGLLVLLIAAVGAILARRRAAPGPS